jgi:hypothetical protein
MHGQGQLGDFLQARYLAVNIWAPTGIRNTPPVMGFVHGGVFVAGSINAPLYDGTAFARDGVILVTRQLPPRYPEIQQLGPDHE